MSHQDFPHLTEYIYSQTMNLCLPPHHINSGEAVGGFDPYGSLVLFPAFHNLLHTGDRKLDLRLNKALSSTSSASKNDLLCARENRHTQRRLLQISANVAWYHGSVSDAAFPRLHYLILQHVPPPSFLLIPMPIYAKECL